MTYDERNRGPESRWEQERNYSSDRPYGDGEYGLGRRGGSEGQWRGMHREYGWRGEPEYSDPRDYSGVSFGRTGGHTADIDVRRTGAGLEAGYMNFHRPDAPDWRALEEWRAMEYNRDGYGNRYGYDAPRRWGTRDWGPDSWRVAGPHTGRGPRGYQRPDDRIHDDVSDRLTAHGFIDATDIECKVENGEVLLTGFVESRAAKRAAEDVADDVAGVREVHNHLRVRPAPGHDGVGRTSVLGLHEPPTAARPDTPPDQGRSRTRT
jgi:hypothetical protein